MKSAIEIIRNRTLAAKHTVATISVGALILLLGYHVIFGTNGLLAYHAKRQQSREIQQQIEGLQHQNEALQQQIKALKNDPQAIEKEARESLHYARPGEVVYTLPPASQTMKTTQK